MAWQTPKTNWVAGDIPGAGDFNRSEGNAKYLKEQVDGLKNGSIKAGDAKLINGLPIYARIVPSDAVILEANTQRRVYVDDGSTLVKEFALKYPGIYRFKCEVRGGTGSFNVSVSGWSSGRSEPISATNWQPINFEIGTGLYGSVVRVALRATSSYVYIRNVKICGTLTMAEPEYAVLRN